MLFGKYAERIAKRGIVWYNLVCLEGRLADAGMMELVDMRDLGSRAEMHWGSSPHARTKKEMRNTFDAKAEGHGASRCFAFFVQKTSSMSKDDQGLIP